jgi:hypothetical protein
MNGMARKGHLFIVLGSHIYPFCILPGFYTILKEKHRKILAIQYPYVMHG